jgi:uncharacterized protein YuzE
VTDWAAPLLDGDLSVDVSTDVEPLGKAAACSPPQRAGVECTHAITPGGVRGSMQKMTVDLDTKADAAYARVADRSVASTKELDPQRVVDYDSDGEIVGIEFLAVGRGVKALCAISAQAEGRKKNHFLC